MQSFTRFAIRIAQSKTVTRSSTAAISSFPPSILAPATTSYSLYSSYSPHFQNNHNSHNFTPRAFASTMSSQTERISDGIKRDHRELEEYYNYIIDTSDPDKQTRYQNQFIWELARHSIGEELVVYPAFEKLLEDGAAMAKKDREEHQAVKNQLYEFQKLSPDHPEFISSIKSLMSNLREHIEEEEKHDLKKLEDALSEDESVKMARSFSRTKHFVPTQSHPSAPDKPPYETVAGLLAAPMDKLMDMFKKFPQEYKG